MSGIVFLQTKQLALLTEFYTTRLGCDIWLTQPDCTILRHGNLLFGLCDRPAAQTDLMLTFFYESKKAVDAMHHSLSDIATDKPQLNKKYGIYQFFAKDPEGRPLECQYFSKPTAELLTGDQLLLKRRSVRSFRRKKVDLDTVRRVIDFCRYAPSARNLQAAYYKIITDPDTLDMLAVCRTGSSEPLGAAPLDVAICADPSISKYYVEDGCIAATYFLLAARQLGLGTCWIGNLDTPSIKKLIGVPKDHYIATITPLGYPSNPQERPERKTVEELIR